ncbi:MAG TPA: NAD-dependent epimerase/dehydratase family protein, partial [Anaerolineae bacterium]|nr:NAD-dependent epimerase/dehydratase family protein [Anaerolineae bacterium]
ADVRDAAALLAAARDQEAIVHLAGQVAVTTSVIDPRGDFEANAIGTFNALEAARLSRSNPVFLYSSTNKVYGGMDDVALIEGDRRYAYRDYPQGIPETSPLDFHSPYGCSKGTGDQYVRDYARIYGLRSVVFRQSAIYGPRQFGIEDQGWLAWFIIAAVTGKSITIYGDGKQVRDVLFIDDLINLYETAIARIDRAAGQVFNVGGGADNILSIWTDFGPLLEDLLGRKLNVGRGDWRPGDQRIYVSDIRKAKEVLGWSPKINPKDGVKRLFDWVVANRSLFVT